LAASAVFYCYGPVPDAGAVVSNTVGILIMVSAPANADFSSVTTAVAGDSGIYEPPCVQQIPLPTP
jgi:hypothetical protein